MRKLIAFFVSGLFTVTFCAAQTPGSAFRQEGIASWYGVEFEGRPTASGELFDPNQFTAAHPDLPFGTMLIVTNAVNGEKVLVRVNDRGPFVKSRIIDVSRAAAEKLNMLETGTAQVVIELAPRSASTGIVATNTPEVYDAATGAPAAPPPTVPAAQPSSNQQQPPANPAVPPPYTPRQPTVVQNPPAPPATRQTAAATPQTATAPQASQTPPRTTGQTEAAVQPPAATPQTSRQPPVAVPPAGRQPPAAVPQASRQPPVAVPPAGRQPPAAVPQTSRQPPPSFQPIPTTPRPPVPSQSAPATVPPPATDSVPAASASQPQRTYPSYPTANIIGGPVVNGRYYRLQVGSFKVAKNAVDVFDRLSSAGLNPQWEPFGNLYRIVLSNVRAEDVNSIATRLGKAGFKEVSLREER